MQAAQLLSWLSSLLATLNPVPAPPFTVIVEGNVGSGQSGFSAIIKTETFCTGKSTFLDILQSWPGVETFPEPVAAWQEVSCPAVLCCTVRRWGARTCWRTCTPPRPAG